MGDDLPLNSHVARKDLQDILLSKKKKVAFKYIEDDMIYNKIYTLNQYYLFSIDNMGKS